MLPSQFSPMYPGRQLQVYGMSSPDIAGTQVPPFLQGVKLQGVPWTLKNSILLCKYVRNI